MNKKTKNVLIKFALEYLKDGKVYTASEIAEISKECPYIKAVPRSIRVQLSIYPDIFQKAGVVEGTGVKKPVHLYKFNAAGAADDGVQYDYVKGFKAFLLEHAKSVLTEFSVQDILTVWKKLTEEEQQAYNISEQGFRAQLSKAAAEGDYIEFTGKVGKQAGPGKKPRIYKFI